MEFVWRKKDNKSQEIVVRIIEIFFMLSGMGGKEPEQPKKSRCIKTDLKPQLKSYKDVCLSHASISPGFEQSESEVFC